MNFLCQVKSDNRGNLLLADNHDVGPSEAGNLSITAVMSLIITESSRLSDQPAHDMGHVFPVPPESRCDG